jgi:hypothetical protein
MRHLSEFTKIEQAKNLIAYYSEHLEFVEEKAKSLVRSKIAEWRSLVSAKNQHV